MVYIEDYVEMDKVLKNQTEEEIKKKTEEHQTKQRKQVLEIINDLPDADIEPPKNVLFVCKLNPVTLEHDLELIFSRFGAIKSCEIIRDWKTGDSLQYAFIEFETESQCVDAYSKMQNVLIDEKRIHVDFSQSVSKEWNQHR
jgi:peptidyl-prolyl cis-trans isomerase-like 4